MERPNVSVTPEAARQAEWTSTLFSCSMRVMTMFRLLTVLALTLALDALAPLAPEVTEDFAGSQELIRVSPARQTFRLVWDVSVPPRVGPAQAASVPALKRSTWQPAGRTVTHRFVRKMPSSLPDSPSAPEAH